MANCIFCQIVEKKIPCYQVYEDEFFLGFLDIYPRVLGHTLLIPKKHYRWVYEVPEFGKYWQAALKITCAIQKALNPDFVSYVTHGLDVEHAHIHIMPRTKLEPAFVPEIKKVSKTEFENIAKKISSQLTQE